MGKDYNDLEKAENTGNHFFVCALSKEIFFSETNLKSHLGKLSIWYKILLSRKDLIIRVKKNSVMHWVTGDTGKEINSYRCPHTLLLSRNLPELHVAA